MIAGFGQQVGGQGLSVHMVWIVDSRMLRLGPGAGFGGGSVVLTVAIIVVIE